jgi:tRNA G18 (ribose-2'-O)-methylase SpoU
MGTVFQVPWTYIETDITEYPAMLRKMGFSTAAMALRDDSVDIDDESLNSEEKLAVIMGTEGDGLLDSTIEACNYTVKIPMSHGVDSLNVAAASSVAFWQLGRKKK